MTPSSPTLEAPSADYSRAGNTIGQVASGAVQAATNAVQKLAEYVPAAIAAVTSTSPSASRADESQQTTETTPPPQSKSPKPETNGKLDRRFKFPNSPSSPTSASLPTMPDSKEQESNAGAEASTAAAVPDVNPEAEVSASQSSPRKATEDEPVEPESAGPINVTEEPKSTVAEPVELPVVANTPVAASTSTETKHEQELDDKAKRWMERQSTVDASEKETGEDQSEGKKSSGIIDDLLAEDSNQVSGAETGLESKVEEPVAQTDLVEASEVEPPTPGASGEPNLDAPAEAQVSELAEPVKVTEITESKTSEAVQASKEDTETEPKDEPSSTETPDEIVTPAEPTAKSTAEAEDTAQNEQVDNNDINEEDEAGEEGEASGTTTPATGTITPGGGGSKSTGKKKKGKGKKGK